MADVAVIVPAHNASATLGRTLRALDLQTIGFELVVVDDASSDDTAATASRGGARVVTLPRQTGPAGARNAGVAATDAPLIAFTDADCEPAPGWLSAVVSALADHDLVQGPVEPVEPAGPYDRTLAIDGPSPLFETANLAVRRSAFDRVGGFEPLAAVDDGGHFGEDALFGWRAVRGGARVGFAPGALVRHAVFPRDARGYFAERRRLRFFPFLVREAPELRTRLFARVFLSRATARFDLAVLSLGVAAFSRRWLLLGGTVPYLRGRHDPVLVAGDAIGLVALVRGSLAARRVVL